MIAIADGRVDQQLAHSGRSNLPSELRAAISRNWLRNECPEETNKLVRKNDMAKSYLTNAQHHFEKIKYYSEHGGPNGHAQANSHYYKLGDCYSKSAAKFSGEAGVIHAMYVEAGVLMEVMKAREAPRQS